MASLDNNELPIPTGPDDQNKRRTSRHLPNFFRTDSNKKFLGGTMDVLTQPGTLTRIGSYVGRRDIPNYNFDDNYITESSTPRQYYQLEPAFVNQDSVDESVDWYADYIDYMNSLKYFGANISNHSKLNKQEAYTWEPHIDWDKFVNYREYYWLPNGPDPIVIFGELEKIVSTFSVRAENQGDNIAYVFDPEGPDLGLIANPRLTLYRGLTYRFEIDTPHKPFAIKTKVQEGDAYFYDVGVSDRKIEKGVITFTIPYEAPDMLYYMDNNDEETAGIIDIRDINEARSLDVEKEILGKKNFTSSYGIDFVNGLKLKFAGQVTPAKYLDDHWYVEGVGDSIVLINERDLEAPATFVKSEEVPFDDQPFDSLPWDNSDNYPKTKDYIVMNRSSRDRNNWARANRWFHRTVLETSATANKTIAVLDQDTRALRPVIEFQPNLKLYNYGWIFKQDVDLVDTSTTDVFSIIEGSTGYIVDGESVLPGYRILFTADTDITVKGKIFEVKQITNVNVNANEQITIISSHASNNTFTVPSTNTLKVGMAVQFTGTVVGGVSSGTTYYIASQNFTPTTFSVKSTKSTNTLVTLTDSATLTMKVGNVGTGTTSRKKQLTLQEVTDSEPAEGQSVYITKGKVYKGSSVYYQDGEWKLAQKKYSVNQAPLFDLFDDNLVSYSNSTTYPYSTFTGNRIFGYKIGTGTVDSELGFSPVYRNINNIGDIEFEFDLENQTWQYKSSSNALETVESHKAFLRRVLPNGNFEYINGWVRTDRDTEQNVVRILKIDQETNIVPIDVYDDNTNVYAIEQANQLSYGSQFFIAKQDSYNIELTSVNTDYWLPFNYREKYKGEWQFDATVEYYQDDIVRYFGSVYVCYQDTGFDEAKKVPTNTVYWRLLFEGYYHNSGTWNRNTNYLIDDIVKYDEGSYICIQKENEGISPTNVSYWKRLLRGTSEFQGEYVVTTTYQPKDIVSYGLYLYSSKTKNNIGNDPTNPEFWTQLSSGSVYPKYWNKKTLYKPGDIVVLDKRPKLDYRIRVYVNDKKVSNLKLEAIEGIVYITFPTTLNVGDKVVYKIRSKASKNVKGYYEIPLNWQNNPFNDVVNKFTFGEVIDHVRTIIEGATTFDGDYPGISNLANLGPISQYGRKFMQHTGPMSLSTYLMVDKNASLVKALRWAAREYSEFKKDILTKLTLTAFDGTIREIVDQLLGFHTQSKYQEKSAFYYSDMVPFGAASVREYTVEDPRFPVFVIDSIFNPKTNTKRAVLIYLNEEQLLYGKDYVFDTEDAFVQITRTLKIGDQILIKDYATTDGCYVPFTPSKLGLYPLYEPKIYKDNTYRTPIDVIQGHDGSIIKTYNDYRDQIILEIERRIFNSVRVNYDPTIFDVNDVIGGYYRRTDFTKTEINDVFLSEFLRWNSIAQFDFNTNSYYAETESFSYNYNKSLAPNQQEALYGYWRGVYKYFFDTDRPHSHPWEMQGFSIKPIWWDDVYGVAPYTSDNKIMWDNIEYGVIAEPNNRQINLKYARPGLGKYLPVDDQGNLLSPLDSNLAQNFSLVNAQGRYAFGDQSPVEAAWRRSSEYPFAVMILCSVLRGSEFIGKFWDRFTIKRNVAGQVVSTLTKKKIQTNNLPFANEKKSDGTRTTTSGLANFVDEYILIQKNVDYNYYKASLRNLNVKLAYRLGGFSSKDKIKILLDSRSPNASGTVFLPQENYQLFYNKSAPVDTVNYSGVIIEKRTNGYRITGYDREKNSFEIYPPRPTASDVAFNVGGVSEEYVDWAPEKFYSQGQLVKINTEFFRAKIGHTSSKVVTDDNAKWQKLPNLPMVGGRDAIRRTKFKDTPVRIPYGTIFTNIQSIVDFLLGYQERLRAWGFEFEDFSKDLELPLNWLTSAKEFMFWTLQNWAAGSVITLSPAANRLKFKPKITASVDNLDEDFYEYSIYKADGQPLKSDLTNIYREDNGFEIKPTSRTKDGIYHIRTNLVYQEHVLLFDNESIFNDVVYDVVPGYRQGRLKIVGYKTNNWDGSYYSPGFMYDNAKIDDWEPNTNYNIGDIVRYKNYYYSSIIRITDKSEFNYDDWKKLDKKPEAKLISNFDYRVQQFRDYYSLDASNFNEDQQSLARHLTGYQPRQYLENIIIDDVSQYKFYQGFIREKGTQNSINKLFDALRANNFSSVELKEEWAFKVGDFGASDAYTELEFMLDDSKFVQNPQDVVLTTAPADFVDLTIYNLTKADVVKRPNSYDSNPYKMKALDHNQNDYGLFKYRVAGYVKDEDIQHYVYSEQDLLNYNLALLTHRDKIWVGNTPNGEWNVMGYFNTKTFITNWEREGNTLRLFCSETPVVSKNDIIAVKNFELIQGLYKVLNVYRNIIEVFTFNTSLGRTDDGSTAGVLFKIESVRYQTAKDVIVSRYNDLKIRGEKVWIDRDSQNRWKVLENSDVFAEGIVPPPSFLRVEDQQFGSEIKISDDKRYMFVAAPNNGPGRVLVYTRPNNLENWAFLQTIVMPNDFNLNTNSETFGVSIDCSSDGYLLVISAPNISNIKSFFRGTFNPSASYYIGEIVRYDGKLWKNKNAVHGDGSTISINSQDWEPVEDIIEALTSEQASGYTKQGAVFVFVFDLTSRRYYERDIYTFTDTDNNGNTFVSTREQVITSYDPMTNERFGTKVRLVQEGLEYWLYVSSEMPDQSGRVQIFRRLEDGKWIYNNDQQFLNFDRILGFPDGSIPTLGAKSRYGYELATLENRYVAVSAPFNGAGAVYLFQKINTTFELVQILDSTTIATIPNTSGYAAFLSDYDAFGYGLEFKDNSLFVSSPNNDIRATNLGAVYHFLFNGDESSYNPFELRQVIFPPSFIQNERFGTKLGINPSGNILVVSAIGGAVVVDTVFDSFSDRLVGDSTRNYELDRTSLALIPTSFDAGATAFFDKTPHTGAVYIFNKFDDDFIYADKLLPADVLTEDDNFGSSIAITENSISIGAPQKYLNEVRLGTVFTFDYNSPSWRIKESQSEMVDIGKFKKAFIYDSKKNTLIDYIDFWDPAKGRIPAPANAEITYQTLYDPANYEFTEYGTIITDQSNPWSDDHVGEIWWDLSTVKWVWYEQGDSTYRTNNWGRLFPGSTIDIYEWTETPYLPSKYFEQSTSVNGAALGITGTPRDLSDLTYSTKYKYDSESGISTTMYYYWVKNKVTIPRKSFRSMSAMDIAQMIFDPKSTGYKFVAVTDKNSMALYNIGSDVKNKDVNLNVQFYEVDNTELLVHREYALIAENDITAKIPSSVENKWFDSLCGYNKRGQPVPDPRLTWRQRYGGSYEPRQSWFQNRFEALKQYFEYVNMILAQNQIVDTINFVNLNSKDQPPDLNSGLVDQVVDIMDDLRFIGTLNITTATLTPVVVDGRIINVIIENNEARGSGYKIAPTVKILGTGTGAEIKTTIDSNGSIVTATVVKSGTGYDTYSTQLIVRNYSVLVRADENAGNSWSIHDWSGVKKTWNRIRTRAYDVTRYWSYIDWYATGYDADTEVNYQVNRTVDLNGSLAQIGDITRVSDVGGSWLLLKRIAITETPEYINDYEVIGKQNATIKFLDTLYNLNRDLGFDTKFTYDLVLYDQTPTVELRIILEAIRDNILINDLRTEYMSLFFNNVNYSLHENLYVDWVFKTSFLKINHSVGKLKQRVTFQGDELASYQQYIEETKPYKSKIREFVSTYEKVDDAYNQVTDFDLYSYYNYVTGQIERTTLKSSNVQNYPWKSWYDNHTYEITSIEVYNNGNGYTSVPKVIITGDGRDAAATAYIANGKVYQIIIDNPGYGYTYAPTIFISGGNGDVEDNRARAIARIGNNKARTNNIEIKYDRITFSPIYSLSYEDTNGDIKNEYQYRDVFTGTGVQKKFKLTFAPDPKKINFTILVNNIEYYGSQYSVTVEEVIYEDVSTLNDYDITNKTIRNTTTRLEGYVTFTDAPSNNATVDITYYKNLKLLSATDRINSGYNPTVGMYGKDFGQLMTGVDYGGVQLTSIDFEIGGGWDVLPWDVTSWDNVLSTNDDIVILSDGTTRTLYIEDYIPEQGEIVNIYLTYDVTDSLDNTVWPTGHGKGNILRDKFGNKITKTIRIDDPYYNLYDGSTVQQNGQTTASENVIMNSFVGNGVNRTIVLPTDWHDFITDTYKPFDLLNDGTDDGFQDFITFRKSTSEGTILPTDRSLIDSFVDGGNLAYSSARGIAAEEIIVDGDGLITADTSHGPEELVQGQVVDALDITVYHTPSNGGPNVTVRNYTGDGETTTFELGSPTSTINGVIVISGGKILLNVEDSSLADNDYNQFVVNYQNKTVTMNTVPAVGEKIAIISIDTAGYDITEKVAFIGDSETQEYLMSSRWNNGNISAFVTINGMSVPFFVKESTDVYEVTGNVVVQFEVPPVVGDIIQIMLFRDVADDQHLHKWSEVITQHIPITIGDYEYPLDPRPATLGPLSATAFVVVDGVFLEAPDYEFYTFDGTNRTFIITDLRYPSYDLKASDIEVYNNGIKLVSSRDYLLNSASSSVTINNGVAVAGDSITIEILKFADYKVDVKNWDGSSIQELSIILNKSRYILKNQKMMRVTTFTNHDIIKIKTSNVGFRFNTGYDVQVFDITKFDILSTAINTSGIFNLPRTVGTSSGVFVALNKKLLSPNIDYVVLDSKDQIKVLLPDILSGSDYIQIITFDDKTVQPSYGFKIFKDMINRYSYKRLDSSTTTKLSKQLTYMDTTIEVEDGSVLPIPNRSLNLPGIIEIDGERIEYLAKDGNILSQLRRGTLGTGARGIVVNTNNENNEDPYPIGTPVIDLGLEQTFPYSDQEIKKTYFGDSTTHIFDLDFVPANSGITSYFNKLDYVFKSSYNPSATYSLNDVVAYQGSYFVAKSTITGVEPADGDSWMFYSDIVDAFYDQTIGTTYRGTYSLLESYTSGDLVKHKGTFYESIKDSVGKVPGVTGSSQYWVVYNQGVDTDWYRETIPDNYGQCDEIEVFVGGRRLSKAPYKVFAQSLDKTGIDYADKAQDSYKNVGDIDIDAEFSVDGLNYGTPENPVGRVRLTNPPRADELVVIVYKRGRLWQKIDENNSLVFSNTDIASFLRAKQVILPK